MNRVATRRARWLLLAFGLLAVSGCQTPEPIRDDVSAIYYFYQPVPWLRDADNRVIGFYVTSYFSSAETNRGVFVPGTIIISIYRLRPRPDGLSERELAHEWRLSESDAQGFRVQRRSVMGDHYGFVLTWPPHVDLAGQNIEVVFSYERIDGRIVNGTPRRFRVPGNPAVRPVQPRATGRVGDRGESDGFRGEPARPTMTRFQPAPATSSTPRLRSPETSPNDPRNAAPAGRPQGGPTPGRPPSERAGPGRAPPDPPAEEEPYGPRAPR